MTTQQTAKPPLKLTHITTGATSKTELIFEFDFYHYEAERFAPDTPALDVVQRLRALAARIERRAMAQ